MKPMLKAWTNELNLQHRTINFVRRDHDSNVSLNLSLNPSCGDPKSHIYCRKAVLSHSSLPCNVLSVLV